MSGQNEVSFKSMLSTAGNVKYCKLLVVYLVKYLRKKKKKEREVIVFRTICDYVHTDGFLLSNQLEMLYNSTYTAEL